MGFPLLAYGDMARVRFYISWLKLQCSLWISFKNVHSLKGFKHVSLGLAKFEVFFFPGKRESILCQKGFISKGAPPPKRSPEYLESHRECSNSHSFPHSGKSPKSLESLENGLIQTNSFYDRDSHTWQTILHHHCLTPFGNYPCLIPHLLLISLVHRPLCQL